MVQAARQPDDGEFVTKGYLREELAAFEGRINAKIDGLEERLDAKIRNVIGEATEAMVATILEHLEEKITYSDNLSKMLLDEIKPGWRQKAPLI